MYLQCRWVYIEHTHFVDRYLLQRQSVIVHFRQSQTGADLLFLGGWLVIILLQRPPARLPA